MLAKLWHALPFTGEPKPQVALVPLQGMIAPEGRSGRALNLAGVEKSLAKAFSIDGIKAVVIAVNSPGGSPTQSRMIHDRIRALSEEKKVPVLTYIEDVGASGGYMISLSGDEIFADPYAIVGSIGVISAGFGFQDAIEKLGVERRVHTAGKTKSQLDPFRPENPEDIKRLDRILGQMHTLFIEMVKQRRGGRLKSDDEALFNGEFWIAGDAAEHGLIDRVGDLKAILKERFGDKVQMRKVEISKGGLLAKLMSSDISLVSPEQVADTLETRLAWARFRK